MNGPGMAPEATTAIVGLTALALALLLAAVWSGRWPLWALGLLAGATAVFAAFVYRDPPRQPPMGPDLVVAPVDGWVSTIDSAADPYLGGMARRVWIRSAPLDVRILRSPVDGVLDYSRASGAGTRLGVSTGLTRVLLDMAMDRPILRVGEGDLLDRGERLGLMPAGGSLALFVPDGLELRVRPGSRIQSGVSVLAGSGGH